MEPDVVRPLILIADPDLDTRFLFAWVLQLNGFETADARTGPETLDAAFELVPDLLVMEVVLPELDGFAICSRLRDAKLKKPVPVIAVTAYSRPDLGERAAANGITEVLRKPCLPDDLLDAVRRVLKQDRRNRR